MATAPAGMTRATQGPVVTAIQCVGSSLVDANTVQFSVAFSESVTGVTPAEFVLDGDGPAGSVASVSGAGARYIVTVSGISGSGALGLAVLDDGAITDRLGDALAGAATGAVNQQFTIDRQLYGARQTAAALGTRAVIGGSAARPARCKHGATEATWFSLVRRGPLRLSTPCWLLR